MPHAIAWTTIGALVAAWMFATAAVAHHGWNWAEEEQTEMQGTIREVYIGPPHPALQVEAADGEVWTVELGNPRQTAAAGFGEDSTAPGAPIVVLGHRSLDPADVRMKAVRITVDGTQYDIYPNLIEH